MAKKVTFTVDLEDWNHGLHIGKRNHSSIHEVYWLLGMLEKYDIKAVFYVLGKFEGEFPDAITAIFNYGHILKSHGQFHYRHEEADRKPYSWLGFTGGFYFRALPYAFIKREVIRKGMFYCHPHDFDEDHPVLDSPFMNWKRHVGLKTAKDKLERLLTEVEWDEPR